MKTIYNVKDLINGHSFECYEEEIIADYCRDVYKNNCKTKSAPDPKEKNVINVIITR